MADDETTRVIRPKPQGLGVVGVETQAIPSIERRGDRDEVTRIHLPLKGSSDAAAANPLASPEEFKLDPVVGWLVVIDGPGKGAAKSLGFGVNSIGRDKDERISLPYGDDDITRKGHALVLYDGKNNKFYLQHGDGINLTYIDDKPVLQPTELFGRELIGIGQTKLCFVPFCGPSFAW